MKEHIRNFSEDPLGSLEDAAALGTVVQLPCSGPPRFLVREPSHISEVLLVKRSNYDKRTSDYQKIGTLFGQSLLTTDGEVWLAKRRILHRTFESSAVRCQLPNILAAASEMEERIRERLASGCWLEMGVELSRTTASIVTRALLGTSAPELALRWSTLSDQCINSTSEADFQKSSQEAKQANDALLLLTTTAIQQGRAQPVAGLMLKAMLEARDQEGMGLSDAEIHQEICTLLVAGAETTGVALGWTLLLLAQHPDWADRVRQEMVEVLGMAAPTPEDLGRLPLTQRVFSEALRLYPPVWSVTRRAISTHEIDGVLIAAGSVVMVSPWVTHRLPAYWENPDTFDPERFTPARSAARPPFCYFPFLGGPRQCSGMALAQMEALGILCVLLRRFRFRPFPLMNYRPQPQLSLRSAEGIWLSVESM